MLCEFTELPFIHISRQVIQKTNTRHIPFLIFSLIVHCQRRHGTLNKLIAIAMSTIYKDLLLTECRLKENDPRMNGVKCDEKEEQRLRLIGAANVLFLAFLQTYL